jgi:hypothetical protein
MMIAPIGTGSWRVHADVHGAPISVSQLPRERTNQPDALFRCKFAGQKDKPVARHTRVAPQPCMLGSIPQCGAILRPSHVWSPFHVRGEDNFLVKDIFAIRVIVNLARAFIANALPSPIGSSFRHLRPVPSRDMAAAKEEHRHRASNSL